MILIIKETHKGSKSWPKWTGVEVLLVLLGKGLSETEEFKRNWPGRMIAGEHFPGKGIRM